MLSAIIKGIGEPATAEGNKDEKSQTGLPDAFWIVRYTTPNLMIALHFQNF